MKLGASSSGQNGQTQAPPVSQPIKPAPTVINPTQPPPPELSEPEKPNYASRAGRMIMPPPPPTPLVPLPGMQPEAPAEPLPVAVAPPEPSPPEPKPQPPPPPPPPPPPTPTPPQPPSPVSPPPPGPVPVSPPPPRPQTPPPAPNPTTQFSQQKAPRDTPSAAVYKWYEDPVVKVCLLGINLIALVAVPLVLGAVFIYELPIVLAVDTFYLWPWKGMGFDPARMANSIKTTKQLDIAIIALLLAAATIIGFILMIRSLFSAVF